MPVYYGLSFLNMARRRPCEPKSDGRDQQDRPRTGAGGPVGVGSGPGGHRPNVIVTCSTGHKVLRTRANDKDRSEIGVCPLREGRFCRCELRCPPRHTLISWTQVPLGVSTLSGFSNGPDLVRADGPGLKGPPGLPGVS